MKSTKPLRLRAIPKASNRSTATLKSGRTAKGRLEPGVKEPTLKSAQINVETFKGVVQLSGFVSSPAAETTAVTVARKV